MVGSTNPHRFGRGFSSSTPQDWACSTAQLTLRSLCIDRRQHIDRSNTAHKSGNVMLTSTRDLFYSTWGYITSPVSTSWPGNLHADPQHFFPRLGYFQQSVPSFVSRGLFPPHPAVSPCSERGHHLTNPGTVVLGESSSASCNFTAQTLAGRIAFSVHNPHLIFSQYSA